jgi:thiamine biosynthesis lipoprotein
MILFLSVLVYPGCEPGIEKIRFGGEAQGTYYAITYYDRQNRNFQDEMDSILVEFDLTASMWVPGSIISRINRGEKTVEINKWFTDLFHVSRQIGEESDGAFDMTIGPLVNAWGFGFTDRQKLDDLKVDSLKALVDYTKVDLSHGKVTMGIPGMQFDFNGIAQGYSVDVLCDFLESKGISSYLVDIGGEVYARGIKPDGSKWRIGIEKPAETAFSEREIEVVVPLEDKAMATSGSYRKFYEEDGIRYSHTIDPFTGYPVTHTLLSVTVIAETCTLADGYATAFMVMGLERSLEFLATRDDLEAFFISSTGTEEYKIDYTDGMGRLLEKE